MNKIQLSMSKQVATIDIYARVSRKGDNRQLSTSGQVAECRTRLEDLGLAPGEVHVDDGKSAWAPRVNRKGWTGLMARLESGAAGGVIVFDLARFSRRPIEGERLIAAAERGLAVLDSESSYDLTTPNGKKQFRDHLAGAAYESDRSSTRVARGKRLRAMGGQPAEDGTVLPPLPNGSARPFGFEGDLVTIRDSEARVLRDLTARFLDGESQDSLLRWLNAAGIKTSYGKPWTRAGLRQVLTRERNAGLITYRGKVVGRLPGDPIIGEADFHLVLATFAGRRRGRPNSPAYLCSGLAVCGLCGTRLTGRPRANMKPYGDGEVKREYWCSYSQGGCGRIAVDQRALDAEAGRFTVAVLSDPRHAAAIEEAAAEAASEAARLDTAIAAAEELRLAVADRLGRGELTLPEYDAVSGPLTQRLRDLHGQRAALGVPGGPARSAGTAAQWQRRWDAAAHVERRSLLRQGLRGQRLAVGPADPAARTDVPRRLSVTDPV
jgi:Resolvase, N terminal domain/Recombinase